VKAESNKWDTEKQVKEPAKPQTKRKVDIFVPSEAGNGETRVVLIPADVERLINKSARVVVEQGAGSKAGFIDEHYRNAGADIAKDYQAACAEADIILRIKKPAEQEILRFKRHAVHISFLDPFNEQQLVEKLASAGISSVSLEMIPRITIAQKMDVLSSQASIAGYNAVMLAAERLQKIMPMMMTPAGTISPARVFVIGAGVAGLQAIATAKRLGARVEAFDTRPAVEEQVKSLGAKFVKINLGKTEETQGGYARELTPEQIQKQRELTAKHCAAADIVITTAQVFGRKAPLILSEEILKSMKTGSMVVDMAVESGGNVEGSVAGGIEEVHGVTVVGLKNLAGRSPEHASQMLSSNFYSLLEHCWHEDGGGFHIDPENEILQGCLVTHQGGITNQTIIDLYQKRS
jgi:H+-translocating NAD(P) transhydrogenase subunit alpha